MIFYTGWSKKLGCFQPGQSSLDRLWLAEAVFENLFSESTKISDFSIDKIVRKLYDNNNYIERKKSNDDDTQLRVVVVVWGLVLE